MGTTEQTETATSPQITQNTQISERQRRTATANGNGERRTANIWGYCARDAVVAVAVAVPPVLAVAFAVTPAFAVAVAVVYLCRFCVLCVFCGAFPRADAGRYFREDARMDMLLSPDLSERNRWRSTN